MMQQAGQALQQRVPADKREAVGQEIEADVRKYVDETYPMVRDAPSSWRRRPSAPLLEESSPKTSCSSSSPGSNRR